MGGQNSRVVIELLVDGNKGTATIKQFTSEAEANFKRVGEAGTRSASLLSTGWQRLTAVLGPAMATYFSVQAAKDVVMMADSYTLLDSRLGLITKSSSELAMVQDELFRISQETGTAYGTNAAVVAKLGLAMESVHAPSTELLAINDLVNKSLIVSGASTAEQSSFLLQFSQAMSSGVLQGEEFRAMMESNSYFGSQLAKALDTDIAGLRKMSREGKLTSDVLREAFPKMATEINDAFTKMPITIGRAMNMVENSFGKVISEANKAENGTSGVAQAVADLSTTIEQNKDILGSLFQGVAAGASLTVKEVGRIGNSLAGYRAVLEGNLKMWDYQNMSAAELNAWLKKNNAEGKNQTYKGLLKDAADQVEFQKRINAEQKKEREGIIELTAAQKLHNKEVEAELASHIELTEEQTKQAEKIVAAERKKAEEIAQSQEEMFKDTGMMADQHYAAEQQKLVEKAVRWKDADGNILEIENWLYDQIGALEAEADEKGQVTAAAAMDRAQGNYRTLIEQLEATVKVGTDQTDLMQQQIKGLDGTSFTITANLDGSGFSNTIDNLIGKFRELAAAASSVKNGSDSGAPSGSPDGAPSSSGKSLTGGKTVNSNTVININQKVSRSDVTSIISEQERIGRRS